MSADGDSCNRKSIACIILAAGSSKRFGSDKRQALGPNRVPLLHGVLAAYRPHFEALAVVIPPRDEFGLAACQQFSAQALHNPHTDEGIGASLRVAATWLETQTHIRACVIGLADMPFISSQIVQSIRDLAARHDAPVVASTAAQLGFPRALPRRYFSSLAQLRGDRGARDVVEWSRAVKLLVTDNSVLIDIDTPHDLATAAIASGHITLR